MKSVLMTAAPAYSMILSCEPMTSMSALSVTISGGMTKPRAQPICTNTDTQGSVATQLRDGGIFNNNFIANFSPSVVVKEFFNGSIFGKDIYKT